VSPQWPLISLTQRLVACLEADRIEVEALYLFGSHARGEATPSGDIDILLRSPSFATQSFRTRCARVGEAIGGLPEPVQIYPVTGGEFDHPEPGGFLEAIRPDLRLLYRRPAPKARRSN
jgi:predicted nucleotidyltransferase